MLDTTATHLPDSLQLARRVPVKMIDMPHSEGSDSNDLRMLYHNVLAPIELQDAGKNYVITFYRDVCPADNLLITLKDGMLTIRENEDTDDFDYWHKHHGNLSYCCLLPADADGSTAHAHRLDGVLKIFISKQ